MNGLDITDLYERSDNSIASELGARFRSYRTALRLTQKEVAQQSGVNVMTVVRFEKGEGGSSVWTLSFHCFEPFRSWRASWSLFLRCRSVFIPKGKLERNRFNA